MSGRQPPRYVVTSMADATTVLRRLVRAGWATQEGFVPPETSARVSDAHVVRYGRVPDLQTARRAVLAAARGAGVVAIVDESGDVARALIADLSRLGPVHNDPDADAGTTALGALIPEQRALLQRIADGETIAAAAAAEFLSLRTANRRIAQARAALGVRTTREAVLAYLRQRQQD